MIRIAQRPCPICFNDRVDVLHYQRFVLPAGHPLSNGYEVVCCEECGFVYADTAVSQEAYDLFYSRFSKYEDRKTSSGSGENQWDRRRLEGTAQQIIDFLDDPDLKILDVGCANGGLLKAFKDKGYEKLCGLDPSLECIENTRRLGIHAEQGSVFLPFKNDGFDCAILSHTLEHVRDIKQAARWLHAVVEEGDGRIYVEVPDAMRYAEYAYAPFQDFNTEHINHFSLVCLRNYLRLNGFTPIAWGEKLLETSAGIFYPAIYCFAGRGKTQQGSVIEKETQLKEQIKLYISISSGLIEQIETHLRTALEQTPRVIVWGTGQLTMKLLAETSLAQADIAAFVDSNPSNQGKFLSGIPVISPQDVVEMQDPIVIGTILQQKSVLDQIQQMGIPNQIILLRQ